MKTARPHFSSHLPHLLLIWALAAAGNCFAQFTPVFSNSWNVSAGSLPDLPTTGNNVRGVAISPVSGNVLYASTAGGSNHVTILDRKSGAVVGVLDGTGISGGTLPLLGVRVASDGAVYACNLAAASSTLKIYRWSNEFEGTTNAPALVFEEAGVAARFGDSMDVRGAGLNTQIIVVGNNSTRFRILYPAEETLTNANWNSVEFTIPGNGSFLGRGVTFEGTNNAFYAKTGGNANLIRMGFDLGAGTTTVLSTIPTGDSSLVGVYYLKTNGLELISGVTYGTTTATNLTSHRVRVFQLAGASNAAMVLDMPLPPPYYANANGIGSTAIAPGLAVFSEPNNSIPAYTVNLSAAVLPTVSSHPLSETNLQAGGYYTLSAAVTGTEPLGFQWFRNGSLITGATNLNLTLTNVPMEAAGFYHMVVTNGFGSATSQTAYVGVVESVLTSMAQTTWMKRPGELFFLTTDNSQRGLAYNPATGNLIVVSRTPTNGVHVLNAATGAYLRSLDLTGVGGIPNSFFDVNMVAVADDGAVYVCDLTTGGDGFAIYRWANDAAGTQPTVAYVGNPNISRVGDTFSVAGSGLGTTLFAGSRNGTQVALFTTMDQANWFPQTIDVVSAGAGFAGLGLYATATNAFWANSPGFYLQKVQFGQDPDTLNWTNAIVTALSIGSNAISSIALDEPNHLLFANVSATPDFLAIADLYQRSTTNDVPPILDMEFFGADNPNINGTGQIGVDLAGYRVFALNSNNGILAAAYAPPMRLTKVGGQYVLTWAGPAVLQMASQVTGPYTDVPNATSPYTITGPAPAFFRLRR